ncbi:MAG TPA: cadherin domain-containing protein, partial [Jatrophihabitantaceae bacterium]|nr:cadherin domain-containing protein [Jatrophihabitantaceae bacterium]
ANSTVDGSNLDVIYTGTLASNYGSWISIAAPGTAVVSTARTPTACPTCDATLTSATGYATLTGTSLSTPLAAGAAGLVLARSPSTTNADLRTLLFSTGVALQAPAAHIRRVDVLAALLTFNTAPTAVTLSELCIPENMNTTVPTSVGTLTTVDADAGSTGFEYAVTGGADAARFSIGGVNGDQLMISDGILDFETKPSYSVTVTTTDVGGAPFPQPLIVSVCNINEPPVVAPTATFSIPENSPNATVVGTIVATDPEGVAPTFTITGGTGVGVFAISGTGQITVTNSLALDFETTPSFTLNVNVSDGMNPMSVVVTINLTDVNEPPTITGGTFSIAENTANGTTVGTIAASDPEGILTLSITPLSNIGGAFAISNTGEITVANGAAVDYETTPVFTLTVTASDGTFTVPATVVVNLTNDTTEPIPNPILVFDHKFTRTTDGIIFDEYDFTVQNYLAFPAEMFAARPDLPPCGLNTSASRTWVDFFRSADNSYIYGFCALGQPSDLNLIWFAVPTGTAPPSPVYITLTDRETGIVYTSNSVVVPFP